MNREIEDKFESINIEFFHKSILIFKENCEKLCKSDFDCYNMCISKGMSSSFLGLEIMNNYYNKNLDKYNK